MLSHLIGRGFRWCNQRLNKLCDIVSVNHRFHIGLLKHYMPLTGTLFGNLRVVAIGVDEHPQGMKCNELKYLQDTCQSTQRDPQHALLLIPPAAKNLHLLTLPSPEAIILHFRYLLGSSDGDKV